MRHKFTHEQLEFLRNNTVGRSKQNLTELFNKHFNLSLIERQINACCKNHKLPPSGFNGRFAKGQGAWNKGMKGINFGGENGKKTQFKKGQVPLNYRPVGSERVNVDGYIEIKVADPYKWRLKHAVIWEETNGPVPNGHCVIFLDGNKLNVSLENMQLITRKQLVRLNQNHLIFNDPELTKTGVIIADIYTKIGERKKAK
ncbi:MAG: Phage protein [Neobacillus sp.]|nr:Phage protein [Neobacillus sp.]